MHRIVSLKQGTGSQACRNPKPTGQSTKAGLPATSMGTCSQAAVHAQPSHGRRSRKESHGLGKSLMGASPHDSAAYRNAGVKIFVFCFFYTGLTSSQQRSCRYRRDTACTQHTHAHTHDRARRPRRWPEHSTKGVVKRRKPWQGSLGTPGRVGDARWHQ